MKSIPIWRRSTGRLAALGALAAAALAIAAPPAAAAPIPAGGMAVEHASLDWIGNTLMQSPLYGRFHNYFSAGVSDGSEASYRGSAGNATIYLEGSESVATWATRESYGPRAGERQLVHLTDGSGRIEPDGAAEVEWDATFSVNFYGGLAPFSIEDPTLTVAADGSGALTATLLGCASSQAEPDVCAPLPPATDVRVATFSGVEIDSMGEVAIDPDYSEVSINPPAGAAPQVTTGEWGAWPQSLVDFQGETGLSSYWYSSGDEDAKKPPLPVAVDFEGHDLSVGGGEEEGTRGGGEENPPDTGGGSVERSGSTPVTAPAGSAIPSTRPARLATLKGPRKLGRHGVVKLARIVCPRGGSPCRIAVPRRLGVKIGGKRYVLRVMAPKRIAPGKWVTVRVHLPRAARKALGARRARVRLRIVVRANGHATRRVVKMTVRGRR